MSPANRASMRIDVDETPADWTLSETTLPASQTHDDVLLLLTLILLEWVSRTGRDALVARNRAVRWDARKPQTGVDPDLCVISPKPPEGDELTSLCTWKPGHAAPLVSIEVVSESRPEKDYVDAPLRHAASGVGELWVFDPLLSGPRVLGGPHRVQVWSRDEHDTLARVYAGSGPAWSPRLGAWLVTTQDGKRLRLAEDEAGTRLWPTREEAETRAKEALLERIAELEQKLRGQ